MSTMCEQFDQARAEGLAAGGVPGGPTANPYVGDRLLARAWLEGWREALAARRTDARSRSDVG